MNDVCAIRGCDARRVALGLCSLHYTRAKQGKHLLSGVRRKLGRVRTLDDLRARVTDSERGCWVRTDGRRTRPGYWSVHLGLHQVPAHRFAWSVVNGPIPEGLVICHRCDEPACANPDHLFLSTAVGNTWDMVAKGRVPRMRAPLLSHRSAREACDRETTLARLRFASLLLVAAALAAASPATRRRVTAFERKYDARASELYMAKHQEAA